MRPGFPLAQEGSGEQTRLLLLLMLHSLTFERFVFRFPEDSVLPFLSLAELAVALVSDRQVVTWGIDIPWLLK